MATTFYPKPKYHLGIRAGGTNKNSATLARNQEESFLDNIEQQRKHRSERKALSFRRAQQHTSL